jgi:hypothetical protein
LKKSPLEPKSFEFGPIEQRCAAAFHHVGDQRHVGEGLADLRQFLFALRRFNEKHVGPALRKASPRRSASSSPSAVRASVRAMTRKSFDERASTAILMRRAASAIGTTRRPGVWPHFFGYSPCDQPGHGPFRLPPVLAAGLRDLAALRFDNLI